MAGDRGVVGRDLEVEGCGKLPGMGSCVLSECNTINLLLLLLVSKWLGLMGYFQFKRAKADLISKFLLL